MDSRGRAITPEDKEQVLNRILVAWIGGTQDMRLGQLIVNAVGDDAFYIEDEELVKRVQAFVGFARG